MVGIPPVTPVRLLLEHREPGLNNCESVEFVTADTLTGNLFVNDSVFVCGSPKFQNVQTADPNQAYCRRRGCSATPRDTTLAASRGSSYTSLSVNAIGSSRCRPATRSSSGRAHTRRR